MDAFLMELAVSGIEMITLVKVKSAQLSLMQCRVIFSTIIASSELGRRNNTVATVIAFHIGNRAMLFQTLIT
jgi:hypothetical protein